MDESHPHMRATASLQPPCPALLSPTFLKAARPCKAPSPSAVVGVGSFAQPPVAARMEALLAERVVTDLEGPKTCSTPIVAPSNLVVDPPS